MIRSRIALLVVVLVGLTSCAEPGAGGADEALRIAVVPKGTTHEFWKAIHAGAVKAERELGGAGTPVEVIWQGPFREDDRDTQIQVVENFTARAVGALVLAPLDSRALVRPVAAAAAAGIPVVIIDSDLEGDHHRSFVATDNYAGGVMAARHLASLLGDVGKVILFRYAVGSASTEDREQGFIDALAREHPTLEMISSTEYAGPTRETAYRTAQALLNRFGAEVDGIFAVNENSTIGMTLALKEIGRAAGDVKLVGFDAGTQSIADLAAGDLQALVVQDPLTMGYAGVMTAVSAVRGEPVAARIDTGVVLVTGENMDHPDVSALLHPPLEAYLD